MEQPRASTPFVGPRCGAWLLALVMASFALGCERQVGEPVDELPTVDGVPTRNLEQTAVRDYAHFKWYFPGSLSRGATYRRLGIPGIPMAGARSQHEQTPLDTC